MTSARVDQSNRRMQAIRMGVALAAATLLLTTLLWVSARGASTSVSFSTERRTTGLNDPPVITIGVAAALTGPLPDLGWQQANSIQLAISQTNAAGGVDVGGIAHALTLVTADSACDQTQAVSAANALLDAGAVAVVGHSCSGASLAAQPLYSAAGVAMIASSPTHPAVTQQGYTTTFRTIPHDGSSPTLMASYFRDWLTLFRSAVVEGGWIVPGDHYSSTFTALGGIITSRRTIVSTSDFTATLTAIQAENPDVIANFYVGPERDKAGGQLSKIAYDLGMRSVVIGWHSESNDESILTGYANAAGSTAAEGDYAAMKFRRPQDMPGWPAFQAAYLAADFPEGSDDPDIFGAFAYDAARITITAIDQADSTSPAAILDQIAATENYEGVVGTYQGFDANGDVIPQWGWLERYQGGQWVTLHPSMVHLPVVLADFK